MEKMKHQDEGYFLFAIFKTGNGKEFQILNQIAIMNDAPCAPDFITFKHFEINKALTFRTRRECRSIQRLIKKETGIVSYIAIRLRNPITMQFEQKWLKYGRYIAVWKLWYKLK